MRFFKLYILIVRICPHMSINNHFCLQKIKNKKVEQIIMKVSAFFSLYIYEIRLPVMCSQFVYK